MSAKKLQNSLKNLSTIDAEFAEFLKREDGGLLNFEVSDDDGDEHEEEEDNDDDDEDGEKSEHSKMTVASDEDTSDGGGGDDDKDSPAVVNKKGKNKKNRPGQALVTLKMVKKWSNLLRTNIRLGLEEIVPAFSAAVVFGTSKEDESSTNNYIVEGVNVYSEIMNVCLVDLIPLLLKHLSLPVPPSHSKKLVLPSHGTNWKSFKLLVKAYITDVLKLVKYSKGNEGGMLQLMKHVLELVPFYLCYHKLMKIFIKQLIELWGTSEDSIRIISFRCLLKLMNNLNEKQIKFTFNNLYLSCMRNCRFTNATSLPSINFMKQSLVELYCLKPDVAYNCCFTFLQQMARHLHSALQSKKKESLQSVNNWQFCHSMSIWGQLVGQKNDNKFIKSLQHPLVEIILGCVRLNHSPAYMPLRLFCARVLARLSEQTGVYIPVLPIILEPLELQLFKSTPKQTSMKSCTFACCLRMNKNELKEKAFLDAAMDEIFELLLYYCSLYSHTVGFPELVLPLTIQLKKFIKSSRAENYVKKLKQVHEKILSTSENVKKKRRQASIDIRNQDSLSSFEETLKGETNDIKKFYDSWMKLRIKQLEMLASKKEQICKDKLPEIKKPSIREKTEEEKEKDKKKIKSLFKINGQDDGDDEDDDEEEDDDVERFKLKEERSSSTRKRKRPESDDEDEEDDVESDGDDEEDSDSGDDDEEMDVDDKTSDKKNHGRNIDDSDDGDDDGDQPDIVEDFKFDDDEDDGNKDASDDDDGNDDAGDDDDDDDDDDSDDDSDDEDSDN